MKGKKSSMKQLFTYVGDESYECDPDGRISKNNPRITINCCRAQLCTSGCADALFACLKDTSGGVAGRGRIYWLIPKETAAESKLQAAVENEELEKETKEAEAAILGARVPEEDDDLDDLFNVPVTSMESHPSDILANLTGERRKAMEEIADFAHQVRCELQWRVQKKRSGEFGLVWCGGFKYRAELSLTSKDKAEFVKNGNKAEDWKPKPEWCDENGEIKEEYKCSGDVVMDYWDWEQKFKSNPNTTEIVKSFGRRMKRFFYGECIVMQILHDYLVRTETAKNFKLKRSDCIIRYKFAQIGFEATKLYLQGVNKIVQVANSLVLGGPMTSNDKSNDNSNGKGAIEKRKDTRYISDEDVQKFILIKVGRCFDTPTLRLALQNRRPDGTTIGKKIWETVEYLGDLGILKYTRRARITDADEPRGNSSSNSNSNNSEEKPKVKRGGRQVKVYDVEKLTSDEWEGASNDIILAKLGQLGILKTSYDLINKKKEKEIKIEKESKGDDDSVGEGEEGAEDEASGNRMTVIDITMDDDRSPLNLDVDMPALENEGGMRKESGMGNLGAIGMGMGIGHMMSIDVGDYRGRRGPAARISTGAYGPHRYLGDSPPKRNSRSISPMVSQHMGMRSRSKNREKQQRCKSKGSSSTYASRRDRHRHGHGHIGGHGSKTARTRVQMAMRGSMIRGDNDNTNENANDADSDAEVDPLVERLFMNDNLNRIGIGSVGVGGTSTMPSEKQKRLAFIQKNFNDYKHGQFDTSSSTRPHKQLSQKHWAQSMSILSEENENVMQNENNGDDNNDSQNVDETVSLHESDSGNGSGNSSENGNGTDSARNSEDQSETSDKARSGSSDSDADSTFRGGRGDGDRKVQATQDTNVKSRGGGSKRAIRGRKQATRGRRGGAGRGRVRRRSRANTKSTFAMKLRDRDHDGKTDKKTKAKSRDEQFAETIDDMLNVAVASDASKSGGDNSKPKGKGKDQEKEKEKK